jgi:hypothetical protein
VNRLLAALAAALLLAGCSSGSEPAPGPTPAPPASGGKPQASAQDAQARKPGRGAAGSLPRAHCPPALSNCREASGRIIYVERVDPDGDGDAHFVLLSSQSVTAPGVTVVDVKRSLRPSPLPGPGDRLSAAGPVYQGSYGQRQIEAIELHSRAG